MIAGVALAAALALILGGDQGVPARVGRGSAAPDFTLPLQAASGAAADSIVTETSLADYRGKVLLLNFWATWCKPCEDEMPSMERLYRRLHPEGFEMLAVSVDGPSTDVAGFLERLGISFPVALDPDQEISRLYQTTGYPESLLVNREGVIVERYVGPRDWEVYRVRIQELMAGS